MIPQLDNKKQLSKHEIREIYKTKRNQYTNEMRNLLNERIPKLAVILFDYLEKKPEFASRDKVKVYIYLSNYENVEVDTWKIISDLEKKEKYSIYVPKIVGNCMIPVKYTNHFTRNRYGVFECVNDSENVDIVIPDIVITPLLAYSIDGDRIGCGGGYYDRYLDCVKKSNKPCITVGMCFENHTNHTWEVEERDIGLNYVISSTKIYEF